MANIDPVAHPSFARALSLRIAAAAMITIVIQVAVVIGTNYFDYDHLSLDHLAREAEALLAGVKTDSGALSFELPKSAAHYGGRNTQNAYGFRILDQEGRVVHSENAEQLQALSPWPTGAQDFWFKKLASQRFHFAGGKRFRLGDTLVSIDVITQGDPAGVHWSIVAYETMEDVFLPIMPFALLIPAVTLTSIRRALAPLVRAGEQAERIDPSAITHRLDFGGVPREVAAFTVAINELLDRVSALLQSQKLFIASAAHELRTPLAVMLLELGSIDDTRARTLEADVRAMSENVNRLLLLARLEILQNPDLTDVDFGALAEETVDRLQTLVKARRDHMDVLVRDPKNVRGDHVAIREAIRNLIDNSVRHTPEGTLIRVTIGPAGQITVEDSGPGLAPHLSEEMFEPFWKAHAQGDGAGLGLAIVRQAVHIHRGSIEVGRSSLGGAMFRLRFA